MNEGVAEIVSGFKGGNRPGAEVRVDGRNRLMFGLFCPSGRSLSLPSISQLQSFMVLYANVRWPDRRSHSNEFSQPACAAFCAGPIECSV